MKGGYFQMTGLGAVVTAVLSFTVSSLLGIVLIPYFKRIKYGQSIREVGPTWHKRKQGTPTMGGLMFIAGITAATVFLLLFWNSLQVGGNGTDLFFSERPRILCGLLMALLFGLIGFADDYVKVIKKRNLGLTVRQKLFLQILAAALYLVAEYSFGGRGTTVMVPFTDISWHLGVFYWPVALFIIVAMVNAVNLTDGIDGLAASVTTAAAVALMIAAKLLGSAGFAAVSAAAAGGCLGFLVWNLHPARIFMGDTGSLFLGGLLCAVAFGIGQPLLLAPIGIIYIVEVLSDVIQITSFKTTGKRVFKMAPIHHHFELMGWKENKIVVVFTGITAAFSAAALIWLAAAVG